MTVREFAKVLDIFNPVWINDHELTDFYYNSTELLESEQEYLNAEIEYITLDGIKEITIEI